MRIVEGAGNLSGLTEAEGLTFETMNAGEDCRLCRMAKVLGAVVMEISTDE